MYEDISFIVLISVDNNNRKRERSRLMIYNAKYCTMNFISRRSEKKMKKKKKEGKFI